MIVKLMLSMDEMDRVTKSPKIVAEYSGTLRADCSIVDPVILLQIDQEQINMPRVNYAQIPDFGRYYFITGIRVLREGIWEISLHCDVLMSYAGYIRALPALIARDQTASRMLVDPDVEVYADSIVSAIEFPTALPAPTYILAMIGTAGEVPS